jgi:hypothetical protein
LKWTGDTDGGSSLTGSPTRGANGAVAERDTFGGFSGWLVTGIHHNWSMLTGAVPFRDEVVTGIHHMWSVVTGAIPFRDEAGPDTEACR